MELLDQHIEALVFSSDNTISAKDIKSCIDSTFDNDFKIKEVNESLERIATKFESDEFSFEIVNINNGYRFMTKGIFHNTIGTHLKKVNRKKLSKSALETLSIIAYKQPVTKVEVESIRGVNCDYTVQKLLEKELLEIAGRSDAPGRPLIYKTSSKFMDYFGLSEIKDLPQPKDFAEPENQIGEPAPIEELPQPTNVSEPVEIEDEATANDKETEIDKDIDTEVSAEASTEIENKEPDTNDGPSPTEELPQPTNKSNTDKEGTTTKLEVKDIESEDTEIDTIDIEASESGSDNDSNSHDELSKPIDETEVTTELKETDNENTLSETENNDRLSDDENAEGIEEGRINASDAFQGEPAENVDEAQQQDLEQPKKVYDKKDNAIVSLDKVMPNIAPTTHTAYQEHKVVSVNNEADLEITYTISEQIVPSDHLEDNTSSSEEE